MEFVARMKTLDKELCCVLDKIHKDAEKNADPATAYTPGQKVWVLRPRPKGADKMLSWWCGSCEVKTRVGAHTYLVQVSPTLTRECHCSQLRPHFDDPLGKSSPLFYTAEEKSEDNDPGEYNVEKIVAHRWNRKGKQNFW